MYFPSKLAGASIFEENTKKNTWNLRATVHGRNPAAVEVGSLSHYLKGFIVPRWCKVYRNYRNLSFSAAFLVNLKAIHLEIGWLSIEVMNQICLRRPCFFLIFESTDLLSWQSKGILRSGHVSPPERRP